MKLIGFLATVLFWFLGAPSSVLAAHTVSLGWDSSTDSQIVGYRLYWGNSSATYNQHIDVGYVTDATLSNLSGGSTYYVVVTSYNAAGTESLPSNEVSFSVAPDPVPVVNLTGPSGSINGPTNVTLNASASVSGDTIVRVEFYANSTQVGVATGTPYSVQWNGVQPGNYNLSAVAFTSNGNSASSSMVALNVVAFAATGLTQTNGDNYQLTVIGAPGSTCSVYVSEDLVNWRLWKTVTNDTGTLAISDDTANQVQRRFYRFASY